MKWTISIHAARVGSDNIVQRVLPRLSPFQSTLPEWAATLTAIIIWVKGGISIHAARVGSDQEVLAAIGDNCLFQSTLPEWAATALLAALKCK